MGPVGLNYLWFQSCLDRQGLDVQDANGVMEGIRVIEDVFLCETYKDQ